MFWQMNAFAKFTCQNSGSRFPESSVSGDLAAANRFYEETKQTLCLIAQ